MSITKEQRDELRRLYEVCKDNQGDDRGWEKFTDVARDVSIPLLDALDATERENVGLRQSILASSNMVDFYKAERDRLQAALTETAEFLEEPYWYDEPQCAQRARAIRTALGESND
jgi:hypothetical protein